MFNDYELQPKVKTSVDFPANKYSIHIDNVRSSDAGVYECYGKANSLQYFVSKAELKVSSKYCFIIISQAVYIGCIF